MEKHHLVTRSRPARDLEDLDNNLSYFSLLPREPAVQKPKPQRAVNSIFATGTAFGTLHTLKWF